ncbi:hypothetical protein K491DRAFT_228682 [Lophiostoma macrostomum CBS 122681]|uniref:Uncharacterized protein n=1 Tax=Lophiostoma macrostomum CBS 122681 TaxID=1314788 RepID=A0A6A6SRM1_9PLEO|nr:hypothetical protein K491DRAFT_228682 [Lophiostoma macrostomum CBS 122681]
MTFMTSRPSNTNVKSSRRATSFLRATSRSPRLQSTTLRARAPISVWVSTRQRLYYASALMRMRSSLARHM